MVTRLAVSNHVCILLKIRKTSINIRDLLNNRKVFFYIYKRISHIPPRSFDFGLEFHSFVPLHLDLVCLIYLYPNPMI